MTSETEPTTLAEEKGVDRHAPSLDDLFPDFYGNVMKSNITPFEINLIIGRAAVPPSAPDNVEVKLSDNISTIVRVALPLVTLPSIIKLLELQLRKAREKGFLPEESKTETEEKS
ncbi:MAG: hypothetical protein WEB59_07995 [Thermoanaerobaculia bacterium]